jgi:D-3-phosphoglycerate dehydrogenase / 2-oxoglutarate reductase
MKIAIGPSSFASVDKTPLKVLQSKGLEVINNPYARKLTENEIIRHLQGVDGLIAGLEPLNSNVFQQSPDLKVIARVGIGMENVDIDAAKINNIIVSNTPDGPTDSVAEMTLAAALSLSRNILQANDAFHKKYWKKSIGIGLKNINVLIVGYGRIGRTVADLFRVMGSQILVCDPLVDQKKLQYGEILLELNEGLKLADIITLHAGGDSPILTVSEFEIMKKGVIILNSARGNLINENALINALDSGKVSSAWLDVFWNEPYKGKLTKYNQVLLTPHMGTYSVQCRKDMEMAAVKNLLRDLGIK